jgi:cytochrome b6-f complex iron-sulfur subunit
MTDRNSGVIEATPLFPPRVPPVRRRTVLRGGVVAGLAAALTASVGGAVRFAWPNNVKGFGGVFTIPRELLPEPGADPAFFPQAQAIVVHLRAGEGGWPGAAEGGPGGILALWRKCPHLGCSVPWAPGFEFGGARGWFRCPCHQSTYTKAGIRVFGPAPRPLDTFAISLDAAGRLVIDTGGITTGGEDNAQRAIPVV